MKTDLEITTDFNSQHLTLQINLSLPVFVYCMHVHFTCCSMRSGPKVTHINIVYLGLP
jgi:hypothetical protein